MSKITQYLNEHILGEVTANESVREQFSRDNSILSIKPEIIVNPRITNDIRKVARFAWQLAEKDHVMPITMRGGGSSQTGASIGKGIIINTLAHLNKIIFISLKAKDLFVHIQPGVNFESLNNTLKSHGMILPIDASAATCTIGGLVANNTNSIGNYVNRMEVVLANGDLIETGRISRHELDKKKGLQTFEGEIYRKIDGIIEDNQQTIDGKLSRKPNDNTGHCSIAKVKQRDGSFDLTPLIVGNQGTLGIISEIVLKTDFYNSEESILVATFDDPRTARDVASSIAQLNPSKLDFLDGKLFAKAAKDHGKKYLFSSADTDENVGAVLFVSFNDFSGNARRHKMKQVFKRLSKLAPSANVITNNDYSNDELYAIREVSSVILQPETKGESAPSLIDGASIPDERREEFINALDELSTKHHMDLPTQIDWLSGIVHVLTPLQLHVVADKQKTFKLINDYMELVVKSGGSMSAESGEGRLRATASHTQLDDESLNIYPQIREAFDPFGTLNPGVKQTSDLKTLISQLNPDYGRSDFAKY